VLTPEFGSGLDSLLQNRRDRFTGILNGIDSEVWNPMNDRQIDMPFNDLHIDQRENNKTALCNELELNADSRIPLICMISRLDYQKGVDIAYEAIKKLAQEKWQAVVLGTGDPVLEDAAHNLEAKFPERMRTITRFDEGMSRRIYAGSDMIMIPSRYEPCGLTQMIAMRYGCVPIARATGGLLDTVKDIDIDRSGTGFLFPVASATSLAFAIKRALALFRNKRRWQAIQKRGMRADFSWKASALNYYKTYRTLKNLQTERNNTT
jgi:starch synthase